MTTQSNSLAQSYDEVPYPSYTFANCQPERLHALATMRGLDPVPPENATVLEIGCSFGGNLLPFAMRHPNSRCVGVDLSAHQISIAKQLFEQVGVSNTQLIAGDISQLQFDAKFDYIICHGVFSWVPDAVRDAIVRVVADYLSPNGLAYISYNTYPGWKIKEITRDFMLFCSDADAPKMQRVAQATNAIDFASEIFKRGDNSTLHTIRESFQDIKDHSDAYLAHEYLEYFNQPMYFKDFIERIAAHGLGYVIDSSAPIIQGSAEVNADEMTQINQVCNENILAIEQFSDFLSNRTFRSSIITRQSNLDAHEVKPTLAHYRTAHKFQQLFIKATGEKAMEKDRTVWQVGSSGSFKSTPTNDTLFAYLNKQREMVQMSQIFEAMKDKPKVDPSQLTRTLWVLSRMNSVFISYQPIQLTTRRKKPKIDKQIRQWIDFVHHNPNITQVSNYRSQRLELGLFESYLAKYMDGSRSLDDLLAQVQQDIADDLIKCQTSDGSDRTISDDELLQQIKRAVEFFKRNALLS